MHRLLAVASLGWHSQSPPSTILRSIKWTYARRSWELPWKMRYICTPCRNIFVCSRMGADTTIQDERLRGRWYSASEILIMAWRSIRTFGIALLRTLWSRLGWWHHASTEDCSCSMSRSIMAQLLPQSFHTSMISLPLLTRARLGRSKLKWRGGSGYMILGVSPSISAWTSKAIWSLTRLTSISTATFGRSWRSSEWTSPGQLPHQWQWSFTRGSLAMEPAIRPYTNRCSETLCMRWLPLSPLLHMPSAFSASTSNTWAMSIW